MIGLLKPTPVLGLSLIGDTEDERSSNVLPSTVSETLMQTGPVKPKTGIPIKKVRNKQDQITRQR